MDIVSQLRAACEAGAPYEQVLSFTAMLNRKAARTAPGDLLAYMGTGLRAIVEGCAVNAAVAPSLVADAVQGVLKAWQNAGLQAFLSACDGAPHLPEAFDQLVLAPLDATPATMPSEEARAKYGGALAQVRFHFCAKFAQECVARSLSSETIRRARCYAQVASTASYLLAGGVDAFVDSVNVAADAEALAMSAHKWLTELLWKSQTLRAPLATEGGAQFAAATTEELWVKCARQCLSMLAAEMSVAPPALSSSARRGSHVGGPAASAAAAAAALASSTAAAAAASSGASGIPALSSLPCVGQARCLLHLARRGVSHSVPVAVLLRRMRALGFSTAQPEFLLLTCAGLLSEAAASESRDAAIDALYNVYFVAQPSAPLAAMPQLARDFQEFANECLKTSALVAMD